jgi:hypothetical protein
MNQVDEHKLLLDKVKERLIILDQDIKAKTSWNTVLNSKDVESILKSIKAAKSRIKLEEA